MDNIKEHLDSTRYFLISFEVECCCWLYFTFFGKIVQRALAALSTPNHFGTEYIAQSARVCI
jgi:hypothetical protein